MINIVYNLVNKKYEGMFFSLNNSAYRAKRIVNGSKHKSKIYYQASVRFHDLLVEKGYLVPVRGRRVAIRDYKAGYVLFTDKLKNTVGEFEQVSFDLNTNLIKMKNKATGEYMEFKQNDDVITMLNLTKDYNEMMSDWRVELNGVPINSDIYRLFLDSLDYYARWHGEFQTIPSIDRPDITFSDYPTVEIDIQASHLSILYAMKGLNISDCAFYEDDPYAPDNIADYMSIDMWKFNGCSLTRKDLKLFIMRMINCGSQIKAVQSLCAEPKLTNKFGKEHKFYNEVIEALLQQHWDIQDLFFQENFSLTLMKQESEVMAGVIRDAVQQELPMLPIHDSVVCLKEDIEEFTESFKKNFLLRWGVDCKVNVK